MTKHGNEGNIRSELPTGRVGKTYRRLKRKVSQFEFEGFTVTTVAGFIPFPAPHFKKKRPKTRARSRTRMIPLPEPPKDPLIDTLDRYRKDAMDDGEYFSAFGAALVQNAYEQSKRKTSS